MSKTYISAELRHLIEERAGRACEFCLLPAGVSFFSHEVDHVIAEKHGGSTDEQNLAYACWRCNRYKGTDLASLDPATGAIALLFHPRKQRWGDHFFLEEAQMIGRTPEGRATARLLRFNAAERIAERQRLIMLNQYPLPQTSFD